MPKKPNYVLKAGVVIHPKGTNKFYANANIPDDVAETHLANFPDAINDFLSYPADYQARVEARKNGEVPAEVDKSELEEAHVAAIARIGELEGLLAETRQELEDTKETLAKASAELEEAKTAQVNTADGDDDGTLVMENETLKADLEAANAEIEKLKAELEEAKTSTKKKTAKSAE